jgi:hypothetical protein
MSNKEYNAVVETTNRIEKALAVRGHSIKSVNMCVGNIEIVRTNEHCLNTDDVPDEIKKTSIGMSIVGRLHDLKPDVVIRRQKCSTDTCLFIKRAFGQYYKIIYEYRLKT